MRLDHLLSREERSKELLSIVELSGRVKKEEVLRANGSKGPRRDRRTTLRSKARKDLAKNSSVLVAMRPGATPVPIPNTMVKTRTADGTALETVWESRWPPNLKEKSKGRSAAGVKNKYRQGGTTIPQRQPNQQGSAVESWFHQ